MRDNPYILWFHDCDKSCVPRVGGKNASLGEMMRAGMRVPPGFAVTTAAYRDFLELSGLQAEIQKMLAGVDTDDVDWLEATSREIRSRMSECPIPYAISDAICDAYQTLCAQCNGTDLPVAVRSSATAEDLPNASFAGQQDTTLWVRSAGSVLIRTAISWSSLFTARAIAYRNQMGFPHDKVLISVGVQKMANSKTSGVMFTLNPTNGDRSKICIDASWGLGESVVSGVVTPDNFVVDKVTFTIIRRTASPKTIEYVPNHKAGKVEIRDVPPERQMTLCLTDEEVIALAQLGKCLDIWNGCPQDIEWAIDWDLPFPENVVVLQSRPETVWSRRARVPLSANGKTGVEGVLASLLSPVRLSPKSK
ncbi:MAG: phenylphosphate synthase subunit beta [Chloroflexi bacterium]|nr:phenylphosphate synthase subunit beta [Chloroflexota bacterium]